MRRRTWIAALVCGLSLAACGGGSSGTIDSSFLRRANAVCAVAVAEHKAHPFPLQSFDPLHPNGNDLPLIADYFSRYGQGPEIATKLRDLGEPERGRAHWDALLLLVQKATANGTEQITAARAKDVSRFVALVIEAMHIHDGISKLGPSAGFRDSSACGQVYG